MSGAFGLDYTAVMTFAGLSGPLSPEAADLMSDALPEVEVVILKAMRKGDEP